MNPSNTDDESATTQIAQSSSNEVTNSSNEVTNSSNEVTNSCCQCTQDYFLKVVEKLFIICGTFAISFFLFGILSLQNGGRHGDTFFLIGAGFIIILGIYMANQRNRIERLRLLQGVSPDNQYGSGFPSDVAADSVYVVPMSLPTDRSRSNSNQPLISPTSAYKPADDDPPNYEDVMSAAPPPSYESLNPNNLRS